ncbi:MAG: transporter substrate-binding domain-containing protein [Clostridia bacterium]|nr:transporter substrate-binding domain-containing protein [Clostridia bacterium]
MGKLNNIDKKASEKGKGLETVWQFVKFIFVSLLAMIVQFTLLNTLKFIPQINTMFNDAQSSAQIVVYDKESEINKEEKLMGKKVAVTASLAGDLDTEIDMEITEFATGEEALAALKAGNVDCAIVDYDTSKDFLKENKKEFAKFQLPSEKDFHWLSIFFCAAEIGGLAYFIINNVANVAAQIVSFFVNREKTFNSSANVAVTLPIYIIFTLALIAFSAWLNPTLKNSFVGMGLGDDLSANAATMVCSAVQFFLYFPVDKILFHKKKEEAE